MNPEPLVRILPHITLENTIEYLRIFEDIPCKVPRIDQFHRRIESQPMFSLAFFPNQKSGQHGCSGAQGEGGDSGGGCGGNAEEVYENPFVSRRVLIEQDSDSFILAERFENVAGGASPLNRSIATHGAVMGNQIIDSRIIDRADDELGEHERLP